MKDMKKAEEEEYRRIYENIFSRVNPLIQAFLRSQKAKGNTPPCPEVFYESMPTLGSREYQEWRKSGRPGWSIDLTLRGGDIDYSHIIMFPNGEWRFDYGTFSVGYKVTESFEIFNKRAPYYQPTPEDVSRIVDHLRDYLEIIE